MFLQCKYIRSVEGFDLEQQLNDFLQKLPRESLIDVKFVDHHVAGEPPVRFTSALVIFEA